MSCNMQHHPKECLSPDTNSVKDTMWLEGTEAFGNLLRFLSKLIIHPVLFPIFLPLVSSLHFTFIGGTRD